MESDDAVSSLKELNKMLTTIKTIEFNQEAIAVAQQSLEDDALTWRLGCLSDDVRESAELMAFIRDCLKIEEGFRHKKVALANKKILDFEERKATSTVRTDRFQQKVAHFCSSCEKANYAVVHVSGSIPDHEKKQILDHVKQRLPRTHVRHLFTEKDVLGKTLLEGVFFGNFPDEEQ